MTHPAYVKPRHLPLWLAALLIALALGTLLSRVPSQEAHRRQVAAYAAWVRSGAGPLDKPAVPPAFDRFDAAYSHARDTGRAADWERVRAEWDRGWRAEGMMGAEWR